MKLDSHQRRVVAAVAIVAGVVAVVPLSGALLDGVGAGESEAFADAGINAAELLRADDIEGTLGRIEKLATAGTGQLPKSFEDEIGLLDGARDVRVSEAEDVVGYLVDSDSTQVTEAVRSHMEQRGWSGVPLGGVEGTTFVKEDGEIAWTLVTCTQTGDATAVVFRSVIR